jgi:hypothetical protein
MPPLYGPPPDPRQILLPTGIQEAPYAWAFCLFTAALLFLPHRRSLFLTILSLTILLTAPFLYYLPTAVYGAFPTIDKAGSLAFYLNGVHTRLFDPTDPGVRLIGVHLGHLWVVALFEPLFTLLSAPSALSASFAAFNAQGLCNLVLSWYITTLLFEKIGSSRLSAITAASGFGLGLHVFRDLNWYTIEKSAVFWLPLYGLALLKARAGNYFWVAPIFFLAFFMNAYWSLLCGGMAVMAVIAAILWEKQSIKPMLKALGLSLLGGLPLLVWQWKLMHGPGALGNPEVFLTERAALDVLTLWPPAWNRLELYNALNPVLLAMALYGLKRHLGQKLFLCGLLFALLSLGPTRNPLYWLCYTLIPGFWRVAKPEVFFEVTALCLFAISALTITRLSPRLQQGAALLTLLAWLLTTRLHPVYPGISLPMEVGLSPDYQK